MRNSTYKYFYYSSGVDLFFLKIFWRNIFYVNNISTTYFLACYSLCVSKKWQEIVFSMSFQHSDPRWANSQWKVKCFSLHKLRDEIHFYIYEALYFWTFIILNHEYRINTSGNISQYIRFYVIILCRVNTRNTVMFSNKSVRWTEKKMTIVFVVNIVMLINF